VLQKERDISLRNKLIRRRSLSKGGRGGKIKLRIEKETKEERELGKWIAGNGIELGGKQVSQGGVISGTGTGECSSRRRISRLSAVSKRIQRR